MIERFSLDQSIFTSRVAFGTAARSPGIGTSERRELEARSVYPRNWPASPPLLFRSFPLQSARGDYGVARARFLDADDSGRLNNFLVHSYLVRSADVDRLHGNLPWLSTHLACAETCPTRTSTLLPRAEVNCDPLLPFRLLRRVVAELSRDRVADLLTHVLGHLAKVGIGDGDGVTPLLLTLGGSSPEDQLRQFRMLVDGSADEAEPVPSHDILNAWRVAALFTVLPRPFKTLASFSINDVSAPRGYALVFQRDGSPTELASGPVHPFVERCLTLLDGARLDELQALVAWVDETLLHPSIRALADLTALFDDAISPVRHSQPLDWPRIAGAWRALPFGSSLRGQPLATAAKACLAVAPLEHQPDVLLAACRVALPPGVAVDEELVERALALLESGLPFATRLALQSDLPMKVLERLWQRAQARRGLFPEFHGDSSDTEERVWLLLALADRATDCPALATETSSLSWLLETLAHAAHIKALPGRDVVTELLVCLAEGPIALETIGPRLVDYIRRRLLPRTSSSPPAARLTLVSFEPGNREVDVVTAFLDATVANPAFPASNVGRALDIVLDVVASCSPGASWDGRLLAHVLLTWLPRSAMSRSPYIMERVVEVTRFEAADLLRKAYDELLRIRRDAESVFLAIPPLAHHRWLGRMHEGRSWANRLPWVSSRQGDVDAFNATAIECFYRDVRRTLAEQDPPVALAVGVSYAEGAPTPLVDTLVALVRKERARVSESWRHGYVRVGGVRVATPEILARLLVCAGRIGTARMSDACCAIASLPAYSTALKREELARELSTRRVSLDRVEHAAGLNRSGSEWMG